MGEILDEFENMVVEEEDNSTFQDDSLKFVEEAQRFKDNLGTIKTYQGIPSEYIIDNIKIGETEIMPWKHVSFVLDVNKLQDIGLDKSTEFIIPPFVEELYSIGNTEFGFNQTSKNALKSISIPKSVAVIDPNTFILYNKLTNINFEENSKLMYIGSQAFACCESLHKVDLSNCVYLDTIPKDAFSGSNISRLKLNSNIKEFEELENVPNLKCIYIGKYKYTVDEFNTLFKQNGVFW